MRSTSSPMRGLALALLAALCLCPVAQAAARSAPAQESPRVSARLTAGVINLGSTADVIVEVTGTDRARLIDRPELDGLVLIGQSGPSIKQAASLIGGTVQRSVSISWTLRVRPTRAGELVIPPIRLEVDGREAFTDELVLRVVEDLRGEELGHLEVIEAPARLYEGQPFLLELQFGWDLGVDGRVNYANLILPWWDTLPGVLTVETAPDRAVRRIEVELNSRNRLQVDDLGRGRVRDTDFHIFRLRRTFVATRPGTLELPASFLEFGRREYGFRRDAAELYYVQVPPLSIEVLPLPEKGRPLDFSGGVGRFEVAASTDRRDVDVGESIKLTVEWTGDANIEFFEAPDVSRLEAFRGFRLYGTTDRFRGERRTVVYDLAPESAAVTEIPAVPLSVFDTERGEYTTLESRPIAIRVRPLEGDAGLIALRADEELEADLRDLHTRPEPSGSLPAPSERLLVTALALLPLSWLGLRTAVRRRGDPAAPAARRRRRARRVLARELAAARTAGAQSAALARFLAARTGEPDGAWEGRDVLAWRSEREFLGAAPLLDEGDARALAALTERLAERRWAGDDRPLGAREVLDVAERLLRGGF